MRRLAIVTGASSGIGRAVALLLARHDVEVVLAARRLGPLDEVAKEIGWAGGSAHVRACDVGEPEECDALVSFSMGVAGDAYPVLINNAGSARFGPFHETPVEELEAQVRSSLMGPLYLCHAALPWMLRRGGGQIINVLSVVANQVFPGSAGYTVGKTGLAALGRVLSAEYRRQGVRVTNLLPGATDTPLWDSQEFVPDREQMLPTDAVAQTIRDIVLSPPDRNFDEIQLMPPNGVL